MATRKKQFNKKPELIKVNGHDILLYKIKNETLLINCFIKNGFIYEDKSNLGISHLLEHVLTNAWKKCNYTECNTYWGKRGVNFNAYTFFDGIQYKIHGLKKYENDMLDYMVTIVNNPKLINVNLDNEKHAVKTELLTELNNKLYDLNDTFNKNFYNITGLKYSDDSKLQLKNLSKFTINDMKRWYQKYYTKYIFTLIGDIDKNTIINFLTKNLTNKSYNQIKLNECYSYENKLLYVNVPSSKQTTIKLGFPSNIMQNDKEAIQLKAVCDILKQILFKKLRIKLKLVYGINVVNIINECGNKVIILVNADNDKAKLVLINILETLKFYSHNLIDKNEIVSFKNQFLYNYNNTKLNNQKISNFYDQQYFNQFNIGNNKIIYSLSELKNTIGKTNRYILKTLINKIFKLENCLVVYQSNKKL